MTDKHDEKARELLGNNPTGLPEWEFERRVSLIASALRQVERETLQWRPIETAPRDGTSILLWLADGGFAVKGAWMPVHAHNPMWWIREMDLHQDDDGFHTITHWMPLPPAPEKGKS